MTCPLCEPHDFVPGAPANEHGDLWGTSPHRIIPHGRVVIDAVRAGTAIMMGWRAVPKQGECDPDFAWLVRLPSERPPCLDAGPSGSSSAKSNPHPETRDER